MSWTYSQTGYLLTPGGAPSAHQWYSGCGQGLNSPAAEGQPGIGPIPRGVWTLEALIDQPTELGPIAIRLAPDEATRKRVIALGRDPDSFFAHDGNRSATLTASKGCLVCLQGTAGVRSLWDDGDRTLIVV